MFFKTIKFFKKDVCPSHVKVQNNDQDWSHKREAWPELDWQLARRGWEHHCYKKRQMGRHWTGPMNRDRQAGGQEMISGYSICSLHMTPLRSQDNIMHLNSMKCSPHHSPSACQWPMYCRQLQLAALFQRSNSCLDLGTFQAQDVTIAQPTYSIVV